MLTDSGPPYASWVQELLPAGFRHVSLYAVHDHNTTGCGLTYFDVSLTGLVPWHVSPADMNGLDAHAYMIAAKKPTMVLRCVSKATHNTKRQPKGAIFTCVELARLLLGTTKMCYTPLGLVRHLISLPDTRIMYVKG